MFRDKKKKKISVGQNQKQAVYFLMTCFRLTTAIFGEKHIFPKALCIKVPRNVM